MDSPNPPQEKNGRPVPSEFRALCVVSICIVWIQSVDHDRHITMLHFEVSGTRVCGEQWGFFRTCCIGASYLLFCGTWSVFPERVCMSVSFSGCVCSLKRHLLLGSSYFFCSSIHLLTSFAVTGHDMVKSLWLSGVGLKSGNVPPGHDG